MKKKTVLSIFSLNFSFASLFSLNFRLFYLRFHFRFLVFRIQVNHVKSGFFFASKRNKIFASISNFASVAKVRAHPTRNSGFHLWRGVATAFILKQEAWRLSVMLTAGSKFTVDSPWYSSLHTIIDKTQCALHNALTEPAIGKIHNSSNIARKTFRMESNL